MTKETGISVVTINTLVKELVAENIIIEGEIAQPPSGRPAICYHFNYDLSHFLLLSIKEQRIHAKRSLCIVGKIVNLIGDVKYDARVYFTDV